MKRLLGVMLILTMFLLTAGAVDKEDHGVPLVLPPDGAPWHHEKSGLSFPQVLGEAHLESGHVYQDPAWGTLLRYADERVGARADLFVYACSRPSGTAQERKQAADDELSEVVGGLKQMEAKGRYKNVQWDTGGLQEFTLGDETKTSFIKVPAHYEEVAGEGESATSTAVSSLAGVLTYHDHYVKLRYTLPAAAGKEALAQRDTFIAEMLRCVLDASLRGVMLKKIEEYRKDPLTNEGRKVVSEVVTFSEKSPLVNVVLGDGLVNFAKGCTPQGGDVDLDLMRAFVAGATDAALKDGTPASVVDGGVAEVKSLCARLQKLNPRFLTPSLRQFEAAVKRDNLRLLER